MAVTQLSDGNPDGTVLGQNTSDLISLYGKTPVAQRSSAALTATISLFAITGASYVANTTMTASGLVGFSTTTVAQLWDALTEIRAHLVQLGSHKGGA